MDERFKQKVLDWFNLPEANRDLVAAATLILQFTNNRIQYNNTMRFPERYRANIIYQMENIRKMIADGATKEVVAVLQTQAQPIVEEHKLNKPVSEADAIRRGKRADHDTLPAEIKKLYTDNVEIIGKMRGLHSSLVRIPDSDNVCHASDRYPFLKELVALDKTYHDNWYKYDHYVLGQETTDNGSTKTAKGKKSASRNK